MVNSNARYVIDEHVSLERLLNLVDAHEKGDHPDLDMFLSSDHNTENDDGGYASSKSESASKQPFLSYNQDNETQMDVERRQDEENTTDEASPDDAPAFDDESFDDEWVESRKTNQALWLECEHEHTADFPSESEFTSISGGPNGDDVGTPLDSFNLFYSKDVIQLIVRKTNQHAAILKSRETVPCCMKLWYDLTEEEFHDFFTILIINSLIQLPSVEDYWSSDVLGIPQVASIMNRYHFKVIKKCLLVSNPNNEENNADKLAKCHPILEKCLEISKKHWWTGRNICMDESQARCGSRWARCSHRGETKKPIVDYIKIIAAHDSGSGYQVNFHVYTRKDSVKAMLVKVAGDIRTRDNKSCRIYI